MHSTEYNKWLSTTNILGATGTPRGLLPVQLRCEFVEDPLGVDVAQPRLFWKLDSGERAQHQSARQILVASSLELLDKEQADLWDSGKVNSGETIHIPYGGRPLKSSQQAFWKVHVWDRDGQVSGWSRQATWTMGLLEEADWQGRWISAQGAAAPDNPNGWQSLLLRREFAVKPGLERAILHVCGLGQYELRLNAQKAGDDLLSPGWTNMTRPVSTKPATSPACSGPAPMRSFNPRQRHVQRPGRALHQVQRLLWPAQGDCPVGPPVQDGANEVLSTDEQWHTAPGPITFSCIYGGEDYDARLQPPGWDLPGFAETGWAPAKAVQGPGGRLKGLSCAAPPIRAFEVLKPVGLKPLRADTTVYDLGQNVSLMPRLAVKGPPGAVVKIIPAELIKPDGSVDAAHAAAGPAIGNTRWPGAPSRTGFRTSFTTAAVTSRSSAPPRLVNHCPRSSPS